MKIKYIILFITLFTASCTSVNQNITLQENLDLAWGADKKDWTEHLMREINSKEWSPEIKNFCKKTELKSCIAQALSMMAKFESGFDPVEQYLECKKDKCIYSDCIFDKKFGFCKANAQKKPLSSIGLFQLSSLSVNTGYNCNVTDDELMNPIKNISCMVNIANYWLNKDKVFFGEPKLGLGRYHSVARPSSKSYEKIINYMEQL